MGFPQRRTTPFVAPAAAVVSETDYQPQEVLGVFGVRRAAAERWKRALVLTALLIAPAFDTSDALATQPDTWTQPVQGESGIRQQAQRFRGRAITATALQTCGLDQPDTWTQPIQGESSTAQKARGFRARAITAHALQNFGFASGPLSAQPDTWVQDIQGTTALGRSNRQLRANARTAQSFLWQTLPEEDGPLDVQADTWVQDIQGATAALGRAAQQTRVRVAATQIYVQGTNDVAEAVPEPDTWAQPIAGTFALSRAAQQGRLRASVASALGWFVPGDDSDTLSAQPDTWVQETPGTQALTTAARAFRVRAIRAQVSGLPAQILAVFPDPGDVRLGVTYGPTGADLTGTLVAGGSGPQIVND